ncbi:uncharacterized protein [Aegilops tauschii subsp. strangulata]|uniref:Late embryogenesis abundant protein LEA-2 subgroup domain-containing protein n=1 Tax=Aegilops tauschii subsp. strangulata TaxID=200361 RepID=A0A453QH08_AEGTS|nr:uncharacterized protein LOC109768618 [Aegilops tauschii subsp. strangulata]
MGKDDDDGEPTRVRWLMDAARYAVAALVTAVTVAVIARAVVVSLRSEKLEITVVNGTVTASVNTAANPTQVRLLMTIHNYNPSGRVGIQYVGVNITLLYQNDTPITWISIEDGPVNGIHVEPQFIRESVVDTSLNVPDDVPAAFAGAMTAPNGSQLFDNAKVHLKGTLQTQISGLNYTHGGQPTEYLCSPVAIGVKSEKLLAHAVDVSCEEV